MSVGVDDGDVEAGAWDEELDVSIYAESSMTIPGMGEPGAGCGEWHVREFCEECGELHAGPHHCHKRECPDCWSKWAARRAESIVTRLQAARWSHPDDVRRRVVHAVVSPPEGEVRTLSDLTRYRQKAREKAREKGVRGDVCISHGFRVEDEIKDQFDDLEEFDGGIWQWIRENDRMWRSQVYWSPHFHFLGLCKDFAEDDVEDDWVVRRISSADKFSKLTDRNAYESLAKMSMYLLSHATFEAGESVKAITWGGDVHPSNFQPDPYEGAPENAAISCISAGSYKVIKRLSAEACRQTPEADEEDEGDVESPDSCEQPDCSGALVPVFDASRYLQDARWCDHVGRDQVKRVTAAFEWRIGQAMPPPGLQQPTSEGDLWEAFEALVEDY